VSNENYNDRSSDDRTSSVDDSIDSTSSVGKAESDHRIWQENESDSGIQSRQNNLPRTVDISDALDVVAKSRLYYALEGRL